MSEQELEKTIQETEKKIFLDFLEEQGRIKEAVEKREEAIRNLASRISANPKLTSRYLLLWYNLIEENKELIEKRRKLKENFRKIILKIKNKINDATKEKYAKKMKKALDNLKKKIEKIEKKMKENEIEIEFYHRVFDRVEKLLK